MSKEKMSNSTNKTPLSKKTVSVIIALIHIVIGVILTIYQLPLPYENNDKLESDKYQNILIVTSGL